jgi:TusA-related sulfurtransferase
MDGTELGADRFYDAGDLGCGGPTLKEIARLLDDLPEGGTVEVRTATDVGRNSLRAFCRLRGVAIEAEDASPDRDRILIRK